MKHYFATFFIRFFFLFSIFQTQAQQSNLTVIESEYAYAEKIYIQLSSTIFTNDKTVWFKAIVTDIANLPTQLSGVLHVELIDFDKRIIDKKKLKLEQGIADGYFQLTEDMPAGRYLIRAYTKWNENFTKPVISQNYIQIYAAKEIQEADEAIRNVTLTETEGKQFQLSATAYPKLINPEYRGKLKLYIHTDAKTDTVEIKQNDDDSYSVQYLLPKETVKARIELKLDSVKLRNNNYKALNSFSKTVAVDTHFLDAQFFPEGGKLVDGLTSKIGFKVLDYKNKGIEITGQIIDENDAIMIPFKSNALGMGITYLTPKTEKTYFAQITNSEGVHLKFPLPKVHKKGVVLNVKTVAEYLVVGLKSNHETDFQVKVQSRGVVYDDFMLQLKNGSASAGIEKGTLPEGIIKTTIQNMKNEIVAERLFFNFKEDDRISLSAKPHLAHYSQRDKTVLDLSSIRKDSTGVVSNLSVLVINKEQLGALNDTRSNILSYFLLNSELRGTIEKPSYYFNPKNQSRKYDMDALMLTQGWSNYKYENSAFNLDFKFLPEKTLTVSGTVRNLLSPNKPLRKPIDLTMIYGPLNVATQKVDSTGAFRFHLEDYYKDEFKVSIQSKNEKGKKKDFTIDLDGYKSPKINYKIKERIQLADSMQFRMVEQNIARKQTVTDFKVTKGTIALDEVELSGYNMTPAREKMMDLHGAPDLVIENKELLTKVKKWHSGLFSLLQSSYPNDIEIINIEGPNSPFLQAKLYGGNFTFIVIDGVPVKLLDYPYIESLPSEEIKSFELIKNPTNANYYTNEVFQAPFGNEEIGIIGMIPDSSSPLYSGLGLDGVGVYENSFNPSMEDFILKIDPKTSIISIYTYAGKGLYGARRAKGIFKGFVSGFAPKSEFYAPKYSSESENDWNIPDLRSVVHWAPNVDTDENGAAKVEFYNADYIGDMLVIVEGITKNGKIGYVETQFTVDKKIER
ncbi:hypothetical protein [Algibacter sp. L1A34]|uniref:hypothetical protein n=1 Tax=Algibacter sp. L1A34 TaxID=2686365 RepID=UPI00131CE3E1|nr:hypothetical protein [Algibacter sp. L1A34]